MPAGAILVLTVPNVVDSVVPIFVTLAMITKAISAAIKPYSMAVAPEVFLRKALRMFFMMWPLCLWLLGVTSLSMQSRCQRFVYVSDTLFRGV